MSITNQIALADTIDGTTAFDPKAKVKSFKITNFPADEAAKFDITQEEVESFLRDCFVESYKYSDCDDTWCGNDKFDIQISHPEMYNSEYTTPHTPQHEGNLYDIIDNGDGTASTGDEICRFDIEIFIE